MVRITTFISLPIHEFIKIGRISMAITVHLESEERLTNLSQWIKFCTSLETRQRISSQLRIVLP